MSTPESQAPKPPQAPQPREPPATRPSGEPPGPEAWRGPERRTRQVGWHSKDIARTAALVIAIYLVARLLWFANPLVMVTFLGVLFGLAVEAGVDKLERFRIPRGLGAGMIVLGFFGLLVGIGAMMAPTIREQSGVLRQRIPEAVDRIEEWINRRQAGFLGTIFGRVAGIPAADSAAADTAGGLVPSVVGATVAATETTQGRPPLDTVRPAPDSGDVSAPSASETLRSRLGQQLSSATQYVFPFLSQTIAVFAGIILIIFIAIYIAADPDTYHRGMMHLFPHHMRTRAGEVLSAIAIVLRRWLVTQLIAMTVIGTVTTIALLILDVKAAFALGLIAGLMEFIPTVGPLLSAIPAVAMGFLDSPQKAVTVALLYMGIQFLENHLLIPMLMKGGVDVPPVMTILGQALFTLLFGFLGLMVAVPALAASMVAVKMLYVERVVGDDVDVITRHDHVESG
jgi:predicted PurR-regulated permease PerM